MDERESPRSGWPGMTNKRLFVAAALLLLTGACTPPQITSDARPAAVGVGVCHWVAEDGLPGEVDWGTETTTSVHWKTIQPEQGVFNSGPLDKYVRARQGGRVELWLAIQTVGADMNGEPKAPQWLIDQGAVWHTGTCSKGGMFAPWDPVYLEYLPTMLQAINAHIVAQDADYRATIGGVVIMSGGLHGEYQLYSCGMYDALRTYYGYESTWQFNDDYYNAVRNIVRIYASAFPDLPLMLQVGTPPDDHAIINWFVREYRERAYVKWAGWAPDNVGDGRDHIRREANERYGTLFRFYRINANIPAHFGFEPGHPVQEWLGPEQYLNAMQWALDAELSYVCFQAGDTLWSAFALPEWAAFDAQLEANAAGITPTPTLTPIATMTSTATPTATVTPTPSPTITPTATATPTSVPTATAAVIRWLCEFDTTTLELVCKPVP